jgi:hypothetical protein
MGSKWGPNGVPNGALWETPGRGSILDLQMGVWGTVLRLTPGTVDPEVLGVPNTPKIGVRNGVQNWTHPDRHQFRSSKAPKLLSWGPYPGMTPNVQ